MEKISKLLNPKLKDSKRFRKILHQDKEVANNINAWQKPLWMLQLLNKKYLKCMNLHQPKHDQKFRLLCRKTQFNQQLNKHIDQSPFYQWCLKNKKMEIRENPDSCIIGVPKHK